MNNCRLRVLVDARLESSVWARSSFLSGKGRFFRRLTPGLRKSAIPGRKLLIFLIFSLIFSTSLANEKADDYQGKAFVNVQFVNSKGQLVTDISPDEIRLLVSGNPVRVLEVLGPDEPFDIGLVMDVSPSTEADINPIRQATSDFVSYFPLRNRLMVLTFDNQVFVDCDWTTDRKKVDEAIWEYGLHKSGSHTILREAILASLEYKFMDRRPRTAMFLFTDGYDTGTKDISESDSVEFVSDLGIPIFSIMHFSFEHYRRTFGSREPRNRYPEIGTTIPRSPGSSPGGISVGRNSERDYIESSIESIYNGAAGYLRRVTEASDGNLTILAGLDEMPKAYSKIASQLSSIYTIIYDPPADREGDTARVLVELPRDDVYITTRPKKVRIIQK